MKTALTCSAILATLSLFTGITAPASQLEAGRGGAAVSEDWDRVRAEVLSRDEAERIAALARDIDALEDLWSSEMTVNAPNNQVVVGRAANVDTFVRGNIINFSRFDRRVEHVSRSGELVVLMGEETVVPLADAPSAGLKAGQVVRRRFTNIWREEPGGWRLFWRHANVIPASAP